MHAGVLAGFGFAFSPLIADLVSHWWAHPWARYSLVFGPLLWIAGRGEVRRPEPARDGWLLMGVALALELLAVGAGYTRVARWALPLGLLGLCRVLGLVTWPVALLGFWLVPVPHALLDRVAAPLDSAWLQLGALLASAFGVAVSVEGATLALPDSVIALSPWDSGVLLASLLSGLGWYRGLRAGLGSAGCGLWAAGFGAAAFVLQALAVSAWVAFGAAGAPLPDTGWLTPALALLASALILIAIERPRFARRPCGERVRS